MGLLNESKQRVRPETEQLKFAANNFKYGLVVNTCIVFWFCGCCVEAEFRCV